MMKRLFTFLLLIPLISLAQITGKVVSVADGDTFTILTEDKQQIKIRFHGIDCPEMSQAYGNAAKKFTSDNSFGLIVSIEDLGKDKYGRTIGIITLPNGENLNELLLKNGLAWHYTKYDTNLDWANLEQEARKNKVGLWKDSIPTAPWDFRAKGK